MLTLSGLRYVQEISTTTFSKTISLETAVCSLWALHELSKLLVTMDHNLPLKNLLHEFMRSNGVERLVRTFKQAMKASHHGHLSPQQRLENFLLSYCTTVLML